jgi:hypothetical protein
LIEGAGGLDGPENSNIEDHQRGMRLVACAGLPLRSQPTIGEVSRVLELVKPQKVKAFCINIIFFKIKLAQNALDLKTG